MQCRRKVSNFTETHLEGDDRSLRDRARLKSAPEVGAGEGINVGGTCSPCPPSPTTIVVCYAAVLDEPIIRI